MPAAIKQVEANLVENDKLGTYIMCLRVCQDPQVHAYAHMAKRGILMSGLRLCFRFSGEGS